MPARRNIAWHTVDLARPTMVIARELKCSHASVRAARLRMGVRHWQMGSTAARKPHRRAPDIANVVAARAALRLRAQGETYRRAVLKAAREYQARPANVMKHMGRVKREEASNARG